MAFSLKQQDELERLIESDIKGVSWQSMGFETTRQDAIRTTSILS